MAGKPGVTNPINNVYGITADGTQVPDLLNPTGVTLDRPSGIGVVPGSSTRRLYVASRIGKQINWYDVEISVSDTKHDLSGKVVDAGVLASGFTDIIEQMILASDIGDSH